MDAAITAARWARRAGIPVFFDANRPREGLDVLLPLVDYLVTSATFPQAFTGESDLQRAAQRLLDLGPRAVVVTQGAGGCRWFTREGAGAEPGFCVKVVDSTGAGDAYHGAFVYGVLAGWDLPRVARFSNAVAALNCRKLGGRAGLPDLREALALAKPAV
jgi:ribokinase